MGRESGSDVRPWNVGKLPFVIAPLKAPTNGNGLPDLLPFALDIDDRSGALVQAPNEAVSRAVTKAYLKGSMVTHTGMMDEDGIGRRYAEDFLTFLTDSLKRDRFEGVRILEIGCGTGYLLYRLRLLGARVLGVEPGDHGQEGSKRFRVPIIKSFFPCHAIRGRFDLIIAYAVLEHIQAPRDFLGHVVSFLGDRGRIAISVPDCGPYIESGDVSMLSHEHWSYCTKTTLRNLVRESAGFDVEVRKSGFGGALYTVANTCNSVEPISRTEAKRQTGGLADYKEAAERSIRRLLTYFEDAMAMGESVGIYVPGRAINALSLIREQIDVSRVRFFDDNQLLRGTYFPGFDIPIESREDLMSSPTDRVVIMSHAFGSRIAGQLRSSLSAKSTITTWKDLFQN